MPRIDIRRQQQAVFKTLGKQMSLRCTPAALMSPRAVLLSLRFLRRRCLLISFPIVRDLPLLPAHTIRVGRQLHPTHKTGHRRRMTPQNLRYWPGTYRNCVSYAKSGYSSGTCNFQNNHDYGTLQTNCKAEEGASFPGCRAQAAATHTIPRKGCISSGFWQAEHPRRSRKRPKNPTYGQEATRGRAYAEFGHLSVRCVLRNTGNSGSCDGRAVRRHASHCDTARPGAGFTPVTTCHCCQPRGQIRRGNLAAQRPQPERRNPAQWQADCCCDSEVEGESFLTVESRRGPR